ncbi:hypothetical protein CHLNCDRAFT_6666, partial [Chlorella variabilis]
RHPVFVLGEAGLKKSHIGALVHYTSADSHLPLVKVDFEATRDPAAVLFGSNGSSGLLESLQQTGGTLLLNNVHVVPEGPLRRRLQGLLLPGSRPSSVRIVATSAQPMADLQQASTMIKVPPLRARPADVKELAAHYLQLHATRAGIKGLTMDAPALRHLTSYSFPLNLDELRTIVERVAIQAKGEELELCEADFWHATEEKDRHRINLLDTFPAIRELLRSGAFPVGFNRIVKPYGYPLLLALLFFGPQDRAHNLGLSAVWCWWWPSMFLLYPLLGRWWCSVCPFMVTGELVQEWRSSLWPDVSFAKWPKQAAEKWGPWLMLALFSGILVWEDVWELNDNAYLTGSLLALITAGAVISGLIFPRRFWCRWLCPIGGMNGLFAKLSATELCSNQGVCSAECTSYYCLKGAPPDESRHSAVPPGCPMASHSNSLKDNAVCTMCTTCVAMCPHDNVELRLRPPGIDLWTTHIQSAGEASLLFLLLGAVYLHRMPHVLSLLHIDPSLLDSQLTFCGVALAALSVPGLLLWAAHTAVNVGWALGSGASGMTGSQLSPSPAYHATLGPTIMRSSASFLTLAYAYLLGLSADSAPGLAAHPAVVTFLQGGLLALGTSGSLVL